MKENWGLTLPLSCQVSADCEANTAELNNDVEIFYATDEIQNWVDNLSYNEVCSVLESNKWRTVCTIDYSWGHSLREECESKGHIFAETDYTFQCTEPEGARQGSNQMVTMFNARHFPSCSAESCGMEGVIAMEDEKSREVQAAYQADGSTCIRMKFDVFHVAAVEAAELESVRSLCCLSQNYM